MSSEPPVEEVVCRDCGAAMARSASCCPWCGCPSPGRASAEGEAAASQAKPAPIAEDDLWVLPDDDFGPGSGKGAGATSKFPVTSGVMAVALILVVAGVFLQRPGLAIMLTILFGPACLVTLVSATKSRRQMGATPSDEVGNRGPVGPMTTSEIVLKFVKTLAITVMSLILLIVAGIAALYVVCTGSCGR